MKKLLGFTTFIAIAMLLLPLGVVRPTQNSKVEASVLVEDELPSKTEIVKAESFRVLIDDQVKELTRDQYIFGVVAAEMPALYHEEALKAQAVAAYTFACCRKAENSDKDYDITADHTVDQSFVSETQLKEKWGENADTYIEKIKNVIKDVKGYIITYNGIPITAAYHAISSGKTEDCVNVWGSERGYLRSVLSEGDKLADNYISEATFTTDELKEKLKKEIDFEGEAKDYFGKISRTDAGTVKKIEICSKEITGFSVQKALDLRSANFEVKFQDEKFIFTVYGAGHGVGMSQNGANYMAKQGSDFKEILTHYYIGCKVEK